MYRIYFCFLLFKFSVLISVLTKHVTAVKATEVYNNEDEASLDQPLVEIRSVLINCGTKDTNTCPDRESARFEREELFKHSVLRDCDKKLAVTVKMSSETDVTDDEYIPIEHVFEGLEKKRIRLLNPYILRLRRELPLQAYKLKAVDTISGLLTSKDEDRYERVKMRSGRDAGLHNAARSHWVSEMDESSHQYPLFVLTTGYSIAEENRNNGSKYICTSLNSSLNTRKKRSEHNLVIEPPNDKKQWEDNKYQIPEPEVKINEGKSKDKTKQLEEISHRSAEDHIKSKVVDKSNDEGASLKHRRFNFKTDNPVEDNSKSSNTKNLERSKTSLKQKAHNFNEYVVSNHVTPKSGLRFESSQKDYDVYEIGMPEVWHTVHVQLFEKLSTFDGKTIWNDLTKGENACVGSLNPEWKGHDLNIRYSPAEWIPRDEFTLPDKKLCLLAPIRREADYVQANNTFDDAYEEGSCIVLPKEDVMEINEDDDRVSNEVHRNNTKQEGHRKVRIRISRALLGGVKDKMNVVTRDTDKYLTITHRRPNLSQLDLEARADDNELVRVGSSACISTAVSDSTRRSRTVLTIQIGNTGLAAANFRATAKDCGLALEEMMKEKAKFTVGPELIPPRHTRSLLLELPFELPVDNVHCSVAILNDEDKSVAVRDVAIKKGDRCFCVWHCNCVCLGEDPKLLCSSMAESLQQAAGLALRDRARRSRSVCCMDIVSIDMFVVFIGVLMALLLLGVLKATIGQFSSTVALWGLDRLIQTPRHLDHYYENSLQGRYVEYDRDGWPIHPDTKKRTIRLVSWRMEYFLNLIFFITVPCIILYEAMKNLKVQLQNQSSQMASNSKGKKNISSAEIQADERQQTKRRRRNKLRTWMTPKAQDLSATLWHKSLSPVKSYMHPLICRGRMDEGVSDKQELYVDSEQDDTEYVLTQMQKSRESLARSQRKILQHSETVPAPTND